MSNHYYNELWQTTYNKLEELQTFDDTIEANKTPKSIELALSHILPIYLRYRNIIKRLIWCYDQIIQRQKRQFIKRLLDYSIGRMLEYRREIVKLNCSEYVWPDDLLIRMKWTPDDIAISPPLSYVSDRQEELDLRRQLIDDLVKKSELEKKTEETQSTNQTPSISNVELLNRTSSKIKIHRDSEEIFVKNPLEVIELVDSNEDKFRRAILMIQSHERARVGRIAATKAKNDYNYNMKLKTGKIDVKVVSMEMMEKAAVTIQRHWRGYIARKNIKKYFDRMEEALGMKILSGKNKSAIEQDEKNIKRRQDLQLQAMLRTEDTINREEIQIYKKKSPMLIEDITDEIHEWFNLWYNSLGHFGIFPTAKAGGSILIATGECPTPEEYSAKKNKPGGKKESKKKRKKMKKKEKKKKKEKNEDERWIMPESRVRQNLVDIKREFKANWSFRNDSDDLEERDHLDLIQSEIYYELQLKMREIVDEFMRLELNQLNIALKKDHKYDKPKFKFPGMKRKKKRRRKKRKMKKKKANIDVSQEKIDEMFNELVSARIIKNYPAVKLNEWIGDLSYQNYEAKKNLQSHQHRLGEIKQAIIDYCILPLGNKDVHALAPLVKSVCIVGLPHAGKSFLANAICNEIGALLFDLTPSNLNGQYHGKANGQKLMKMIGILARRYPPAIVRIDGGEKPWWKKLPPGERSMRRLAKLLPKFIRSIKRGDQILVLGLASEPWKSKRGFYKVYNKFIILPSTDYNTLYLFYQKTLMNYHGVDRNFDISSLTKATIGYPLNIIREAIERVLNIKRQIMLKIQPLLPEEILTELIKWTSPKDKVTRQLKIFENKTPLGRKKLKMMKKNSKSTSK